jgi:hypothetical protein
MHGNKIASPLSRKATLCTLKISAWSGRKLDREATDEVNRSKGAKSDASRLNKLLIKKERIDAVNADISALRTLHYTYTKPWGNDGQRILPNTLYIEFTNKLRELTQKLERDADYLAKHFDEFVEERKPDMGKLFRQEDYPTAQEIRSRYNVEVSFCNLPDANDFRADVLDKDTVEDIRAEIAQTVEATTREAMTDTYRQVAKVVGHMAERLSEYGEKKEGSTKKSYFTDSLVGNIRDLCKLLPAFNLTGDNKLDEIAARMERELCIEEAQTLRENDAARETVKKSAEEILAEVTRVMA